LQPGKLIETTSKLKLRTWLNIWVSAKLSHGGPGDQRIAREKMGKREGRRESLKSEKTSGANHKVKQSEPKGEGVPGFSGSGESSKGTSRAADAKAKGTSFKRDLIRSEYPFETSFVW